MHRVQPGILAPVPPLARYLTFTLESEMEPRAALGELQEIADGDGIVVGLGQTLILALGAELDGSSFVAVQQWVHDLDGSYFWCPPLVEGQLDLGALG